MEIHTPKYEWITTGMTMCMNNIIMHKFIIVTVQDKTVQDKTNSVSLVYLKGQGPARLTTVCYTLMYYCMLYINVLLHWTASVVCTCTLWIKYCIVCWPLMDADLNSFFTWHPPQCGYMLLLQSTTIFANLCVPYTSQSATCMYAGPCFPPHCVIRYI